MKILVIRRDNIGDLVCATPLLAALRRRYPQAHLAVLANSYNAAVLAGNPDIDAVHSYTKLKHREPGQPFFGTLVRKLRMLAALRRARFDYVLLAKAGFDRQGLALARQIAPREVVGFAPEDRAALRGLTRPVAPVPFAELHEVEIVMRLARDLGIAEEPGPLRVFAAPTWVEACLRRWPALRRPGTAWVGMHISAREPGRVWPRERYAELIRRIVVPGKTGVVLLWSPGAADNPRHPGDDERAAWIADDVGRAGEVIPIPTQRLEELTAALSLCRAFIGPDGGAMHLAAGLALPIVALFENKDYKKRHWHPWKVPYEMVAPATRDVGDISVAEVEEAWRRLASACL